MQLCDIKEIPKLTIDIQRMRIAVMILEEQETPNSGGNPRVYQEMSLLTRMVKQVDFTEDDEAESDKRMQSAEEKLEKAGVSTAGARAVVELFGKMNDAPSTEPDTESFD